MNKIINWRELSRLLSGNEQNIRQNNIPKKYQKQVDLLLTFIDVWVKWLEKSK